VAAQVTEASPDRSLADNSAPVAVPVMDAELTLLTTDVPVAVAVAEAVQFELYVTDAFVELCALEMTEAWATLFTTDVPVEVEDAVADACATLSTTATLEQVADPVVVPEAS